MVCMGTGSLSGCLKRVYTSSLEPQTEPYDERRAIVGDLDFAARGSRNHSRYRALAVRMADQGTYPPMHCTAGTRDGGRCPHANHVEIPLHASCARLFGLAANDIQDFDGQPAIYETSTGLHRLHEASTLSEKAQPGIGSASYTWRIPSASNLITSYHEFHLLSAKPLSSSLALDLYANLYCCRSLRMLSLLDQMWFRADSNHSRDCGLDGCRLLDI